ncbi:protein of unknown function [Lysobacter sp. yr284]|uniref:DUF4034 domain-containing protein n=1 Tax=Lysobacter sp. yr284 TaxID=1761791 RepID=UPI0008976C82|nr:DUF4034 domain-containing protein [Lysobacter sp. yr284]SDZ24612.1 protein of unknown function [Lysobacter sp. yr284]
MDGKRPAAAGLLALSLLLGTTPSRAEPPSAAEPPEVSSATVPPPAPAPSPSMQPMQPMPSGLTREQQIAWQQARIAERKARAQAQTAELLRQLQQRRNPSSEEIARRLAEYQRSAPEREAQRRRQIEAAFDDGPELDMRQALAMRAQQLFQARDFAQLDRYYDDYALRGARTPSGVWKSGYWYSALSVRADSDQAYRERDEVLQQWLRERPQSALARLLRARLMVRRGWAFRGGGYAATVEEKNWRPFFDWLAKAQDYLDAEKAIVSTRPEYYELAVDLQRDRQKSPFAAFDEGLEKFPGYYPMYFAMMEYLLPKWHGGLDQLEHFAAEAVARTQREEGRAMYARLYWSAAQGQFRDNLFAQSKASWPRMREGFEDVIARYPDQWNLQNYASFACDAGDEDTLAKLFERIREPSLDVAWRSHARYVACGRRVGKFQD